MALVVLELEVESCAALGEGEAETVEALQLATAAVAQSVLTDAKQAGVQLKRAWPSTHCCTSLHQ
jgi:hypothetical protein